MTDFHSLSQQIAYITEDLMVSRSRLSTIKDTVTDNAAEDRLCLALDDFDLLLCKIAAASREIADAAELQNQAEHLEEMLRLSSAWINKRKAEITRFPANKVSYIGGQFDGPQEAS